jgi:hypothetical protein
MQQVFVNLIHNAAQAIAATGRSGTVTVRARRWTDGIAVDVIDDGPGMSEALAAQVFEPFFTTQTGGPWDRPGVVDLPGIVTEHGGRITLETADGWGSTFTVHLPAGEGPAPVMTEGTPSAVPGLRILVVDDEPTFCTTCARRSRAGGIRCRKRRTERKLAIGWQEMASIWLSRTCGCPGSAAGSSTRSSSALGPAQAEQVVFATGDTVRGDTLAFLKSVGDHTFTNRSA